MTDVLFYHLTESKLEAALPPLVEKSIERGWHVAIQTMTAEGCEKLDELLWTFRADSFIPHGLATDEHPEEQPVLLTTGTANANNATVRFFVEGAEVGNPSDYERVVVMFDGYNEMELATARKQWKELRSGDHQLTYWQQGDGGRWHKKA